MSVRDEEQNGIRLVVENDPSGVDTAEFSQITRYFTTRDRRVVRCLLEHVHTVNKKDGPEAALAMLNRALSSASALPNAARTAG